VSPLAISLILVAAAAHASWNLFSKQAAAAGTVCFVWLYCTVAALGLAPTAAIVIGVSHPRLSGLPAVFLAGTAILHIGYVLFLQNGYRLGDLSVVYPIGRGTGALLAAAAGIVLLGERPGLLASAGILLIVAGVMAIGLPGRSGSYQREEAAALAPTAAGKPGPGEQPAASPLAAARQPRPSEQPALASPLAAAGQPVPAPARRAPAVGGIAFALLTGLFIAGYTVWDKYAVATLHVPPVVQDWATTVGVAVALAPVALRDRARLAAVWQSYRPQVFGAAVLSPLAYILVLTAMRFTAVSVAAPSREVSVLFGVLLGRRLLGEGSLARRLAAAAAIVAGIIAVAIG
jgi:drug/metabolite transporter (DMT)-like permease